eukprot:2984446-Pyramimonas_sp.AAC.1
MCAGVLSPPPGSWRDAHSLAAGVLGAVQPVNVFGAIRREGHPMWADRQAMTKCGQIDKRWGP